MNLNNFMMMTIFGLMIFFASPVSHAGEQDSQEFEESVKMNQEPSNAADESAFYSKMLGEANSLTRLTDSIEQAHRAEEAKEEAKKAAKSSKENISKEKLPAPGVPG